MIDAEMVTSLFSPWAKTSEASVTIITGSRSSESGKVNLGGTIILGVEAGNALDCGDKPPVKMMSLYLRTLEAT